MSLKDMEDRAEAYVVKEEPVIKKYWWVGALVLGGAVAVWYWWVPLLAIL